MPHGVHAHALVGLAEGQDVGCAGLRHDGGLREVEGGGAERFHTLSGQRGKGFQALDGAGNLDDDLVRHLGEDVGHVQQFGRGMPVDLHDHLLVGDVQVAPDDLGELPVFLGHVVQDDGVGDDAVAAARQPDFEVFRVTSQPDGRAAFGKARLGYRA